MGNSKFGWQKSSAQKAAKRTLAGKRYYGNRKRRRQAEPLSPTFIRYRCFECYSFRVIQVIGHGFRCDECGHKSTSAQAVEVKRVGRTGFKLK